MPSKIKYYNLSIYGNDEKQITTQHYSIPHGWYLPLGVGQKIVSLFLSSRSSAQKLTTKGETLLEYASSLEGTVKLAVIGSCACAGGILSLILRPKGKIRKLFYPTALVTISSAICYPSTAYAVTKVTAVNAYKYSVAAKNKISEWQYIRKPVDELKKKDLDILNKPKEEEYFDAAPVMNIPLSDDNSTFDVSSDEATTFTQNSQQERSQSITEESASSGEGNEGFQNESTSIQDLGQSSSEDSDLYTTRS